MRIFALALTFLTNPLLARLATRWPRAVLVRRIYRFLALNLVAFHLLLVFAEPDGDAGLWIGWSLYAWVSVFSLLISSVLWSLLSEVFRPEPARRLFGPLAAACSLGGLAGSSLTGLLARDLEQPLHLLLLAALALELAARCSRRLAAFSRGDAATDGDGAAPLEVEGATWSAGLRRVLGSPYLLGIGGYVVGYTLVGTWVYLLQGMIIDALEADLGGDIQRFAWIDAAVNAASLLLQLFAVSAVVKRIGVGWSLAILPLLCAAGFAVLVAFPTYAILAGFQVLRRTLNYGIVKPAREMLFAPLSRTDTYLSKNLLDLFVYRAGDALASVSMLVLALPLAGLAAVAIPVSLAWTVLGPWLGGRYRRLEAAGEDPPS